MQLVEAGELGLDDLAADRLPPDLEFDTNGARIVDLLSMRSGIPEYFADEDELREVLTNDPLHVWMCHPSAGTKHGTGSRRSDSNRRAAVYETAARTADRTKKPKR